MQGVCTNTPVMTYAQIFQQFFSKIVPIPKKPSLLQNYRLNYQKTSRQTFFFHQISNRILVYFDLQRLINGCGLIIAILLLSCMSMNFSNPFSCLKL